MKKSRRLIDEHAGVALGYGATRQTNFSLSDGIVNGINLYAAREISWNIDANLDDIGKNWAGSIYGKRASMEDIDEMFREFALAQPNLRPEQASELETRFNWLREFAICRKYLDISLWRYRYLRHLAANADHRPGPNEVPCRGLRRKSKSTRRCFFSTIRARNSVATTSRWGNCRSNLP